MTEMVDDELLGGEELDDIYDITNEREEALLQEDEEPRDYDGRKKESDSDSDEPDDVLNLDIEEDFENEEKLLCDEEELDEKEKPTSVPVDNSTTSNVNVKPVTKVSSSQGSYRSESVLTKSSAGFQNVKSNRRNLIKNDRRKRGNGRGNFQPRSNFTKNNMQRRTVLINPRYEGTVHINENNARLAWDSPQQPQNNNFIQPWASGNLLATSDPNTQNQLLVSNFVTGIASTFGHTTPNILLPQLQQPQHFYESSRNNYEQPLVFEPPPNIQNGRQQSYVGQNQVTNHQLMGSTQHSFPRTQQPHYNNQMSSNRMPGDSKSYGSYSSYNNYDQPGAPHDLGPRKPLNMSNSFENKNMNYNKYNNRPSSYNNNYQNRNTNYSTYFPKQGNNHYNTTNYEDHRPNVNVARGGSQPDFKQNEFNTFNQTIQRNFDQQNQFETESKRPNNFNSPYKNVQSQNFDKQWNRRIPVVRTFDNKDEIPEKKLRINENIKNSIPTVRDNIKLEEEIQSTKMTDMGEGQDEETRLYMLKIEEQKRERERVLKAKEERRKQMIEQQKHTATALEEKPQNLPRPAQFIKTNSFEQSAGTVSVQNQFASGSGVKRNTIHPRQFPRQIVNLELSSNSSSYPQQKAQQFNDPDPDLSVDIPTLTFKVSNDLQSKTPIKKELPKTEASSSSFMSNRVVLVKNKNNQKSGGVIANPDVSKTFTKTVNNENVNNEASDVGQGLSSFFNNRKVLKKDNALLNTRLVVIHNLSTSINQNKLMALSRGIGEIQKLRVDTQERQATILFKSVASAHAFFKKYQRRILDDLSVIEVKLEPML